MGGYGGYVWAAFGFTIVLMIGLLWQSWRLQQRRTDELAGLRRTLRGDTPDGDGRPGDTERPARRLVARKPDAAPAAAGQGAGAFDPGPVTANRSTSGS
jgi:heme exporter protein CcmD